MKHVYSVDSGEQKDSSREEAERDGGPTLLLGRIEVESCSWGRGQWSKPLFSIF